jgi:hypothetical protein
MSSGQTQPGRSALILIPLAALVVVAPLIIHGCSCGHDFDFHLLSWMEAARQFSQGKLHPHWAFTPAYNAGEPRFVFYPPISWYVGALLGLLLTHLPGVSETGAWNAAPIVFTWIALTLSGLTMYRLARRYASANAALLAAAIYLANPYMLFTAYERTAYAELLAAAWIPLLFDAILRENVTIAGIALPVALLWLTNAPAAVMGSYTLALLAVLRLATNAGAPHLASEMWVPRRSSLNLALNILRGSALGFALAAFYIVPAAHERRFVQVSMATIEGMRIDHNFLFEHTGKTADALFHDLVLQTASLIAVLMLGATAIALFAASRRRGSSDARGGDFPALPLAILTACIALLLTPLSVPIWRHAPEASFLQFPWRLLAMVAPVFALALARAVTHTPGAPSTASLPRVGRRRRRNLAMMVAALLVAAALSLPANHFFGQACDPEDTVPARLALFHSNAGTDPTDEYTPMTADNDALHPNNPPYWLADSPNAAAPAADSPGPAPMHLNLMAPHAEELILNLRDYPAWLVFRNGQAYAARDRRADGLIAVPLSAGASTIDIRYAHTLDQTAGDGISVLAVALFVFAVRRKISR